jgi:hypothetical protein
LFLALNPFVPENFISFGQEFFVEDGIFDQVVHLGRWQVHNAGNLIKIPSSSNPITEKSYAHPLDDWME